MDEAQRDWVDTLGVETETYIQEADEDEEPECSWLEAPAAMGL